jgi:LysR family transcriptional regulator for metE and metH
LRLVAEVARTESVTRAADRLHVTQSAVSHQLREIQDRLGTPIFIRAGRRMVPTPAGQLLVDAAARVLESISEVEVRVSQLARNTGGELRLASHCYTGYHWLPALIGGLRHRYPETAIRLSPEYTLNPIAALLDTKIDLAIVNQHPRDKRLRVRELFEDEYVAVVHRGHAWAARSFVTPDALAVEPLYLYSRSLADNFVVKHVMRPAGLDLQRVTYLQLTEGILEMIKAGLGSSVLPKWSIANAVAAGDVKAVRITKPGVYRTWYAVALNGAPASPFMDDFIRLLIKQGPAARKTVRRTHSLAS